MTCDATANVSAEVINNDTLHKSIMPFTGRCSRKHTNIHTSAESDMLSEELTNEGNCSLLKCLKIGFIVG